MKTYAGSSPADGRKIIVAKPVDAPLCRKASRLTIFVVNVLPASVAKQENAPASKTGSYNRFVGSSPTTGTIFDELWRKDAQASC